MTKSESIAKLAAALAAAQSKFKLISKDKTARITSQKGSFSYAYADLHTVVEATKEALAANGLSLMQPARLGDGQIVVTSILAHGSGEWISEEMAWPVADTDNRSIGSGITYARRHSYLAIIGAAATDEDDDGESARGGDHETARPAPRPQNQPQRPPPPRQQPDQPEMTEADKAKVLARAARDKQIFDGAIATGIQREEFHGWAETILAHPYAKNTDWTDKDRATLEAEIVARREMGGSAA